MSLRQRTNLHAAAFAGSLKVVSARLSQAGVPLVVLANQHAFLFHLNMRCWQRVADDTFPASNFVTTWPDMSTPAAEAGELASIQAGVTSAAGQTFIWNRLVIYIIIAAEMQSCELAKWRSTYAFVDLGSSQVLLKEKYRHVASKSVLGFFQLAWNRSSLEEEKWQTRAHLEIQMAAAQALQSASEYRRFLLAYSRCLARWEVASFFILKSSGPLAIGQRIWTVWRAATWSWYTGIVLVWWWRCCGVVSGRQTKHAYESCVKSFWVPHMQLTHLVLLVLFPNTTKSSGTQKFL